ENRRKRVGAGDGPCEVVERDGASGKVVACAIATVVIAITPSLLLRCSRALRQFRARLRPVAGEALRRLRRGGHTHPESRGEACGPARCSAVREFDTAPRSRAASW